MATGSPLRWKSTIATRPFGGEEFHEDQHEKHAGQKTTAVGIKLYIFTIIYTHIYIYIFYYLYIYIYENYCVCFYVGCVCLCFLFDSYFVVGKSMQHSISDRLNIQPKTTMLFLFQRELISFSENIMILVQDDKHVLSYMTIALC